MNVANTASDQPRYTTPLLLLLIAPFAGLLLGAVMNAINGHVSPDYFAIVMSWDWAQAPLLAIAQGMVEGFALGLFFGFFLAIVVAASTRLRCPLPLALRTLGLALAIVAIAWIIGGVIGVTLALLRPQLWGFFFIGVPPRVNLPRFAWVGGSIWGAYAGTLIALVIASIALHRRWRRERGGMYGFSVLPAPPPPLPMTSHAGTALATRVDVVNIAATAAPPDHSAPPANVV